MQKKNYFILLIAAILLSACGSQTVESAVTETPAHNMANVFPEVEPIYDTYEKDGTKIEFTVKSDDQFLGNAEVSEGSYATVKFHITDAVSGEPLSDVRPAAWMDYLASNAAEGEQACKERIDGYLKGQISNRPLVDLNSFFILALNSGNTISVIDPLVQVGGITQLYTTLLLESRGEDWVTTSDGGTLYISLPEAGQVAIADLGSFRVTDRIDAGDVPVRVVLQPGDGQLWVGNDSQSLNDSGVTIIDTASKEILARLSLGAGHHEIDFTPDGKFAFVTSEAADEVTLIDTKSLKKIETSTTSRLPVAVKVSADGARVFVVNGGEGTMDIFAMPGLAFVSTIALDEGITGMQTSPDGRWALVMNPNQNKVYIIDLQTATLTGTLSVDNAPDQVVFGRELAYIRPYNGTSLYSFKIADLGSETIELTEVPYAQSAPGHSPEYSIANPLAALPDEGAILAANAADNMIYYLVEGTLSPAGSYRDQATLPRAVRFVDRSLQQEAPGVFSGKVLIPSGGTFQVSILLDTQRITHCFKFTAKAAESEVSAQAQVKIEPLSPPSELKSKEQATFKFKITDAANDQPLDGIEDFVLSVNQIGGNWNQRFSVVSVGGGLYESQVSIPQSGMYQILPSITSRNVGLDAMAPLRISVTD